MQQLDIDKYESDLVAFLNVDVTNTSVATIQTKITEIETDRQTVLAQQNTSEIRDNVISILRNEDYNKILLYGVYCKSYYEYNNKIANEPDVDLKTILIEEKQALQNTICGLIGNDDYLTNLFYLIKFMNHRTC